MKKWRTWGLAVVLAGSTALAACGNNDSGGGGSDSGTVTVGWTGQLTGAQAIFGEQSTNAIKMALEDIKATGGPDIEVVYEDNEGDPTKAVTAFQSLMSKKPVTVITGGSSVVIALAPLAEQNKITVTNVAAQSPELTTDKYPSVYNFVPTGKAEAEGLADRLYNGEGLRTVATEFVDADYGIDTTEAFTKAFEDLGGKVVAAERHDFDATDMRTQLRKIKSTGAEALVVCASEGEVGHVAAQADELKIGMPVYGFTYALSPTNYKLADGAMKDWRGVAVNFDATSGAGQDFATRYKDKYGKDPIIYGAISYQTMMMLGEGIKEVGDDPEALQKYMAGIKDFDGVMGVSSMGEDREIELPLKYWQIGGAGDTVEDWN